MVLLAILIIILAVVFVHESIVLHHEQLVSAHELALSSFLQHHRPLTAGDVTIIRPWMTFAYIDKLFNVSSTYLQSSLSIQDPHYPQLSLSGYANYEHESVATLTTEVEDSLSTYLTATSTAH